MLLTILTDFHFQVRISYYQFDCVGTFESCKIFIPSETPSIVVIIIS